MKYKIVLVPFPFDDLAANKVRPAVCLTNIIGPHSHVVLAFITSRIKSDPLSSDVILSEHEPDFAVTGLKVSSTLQLHRLVTVGTSIILRELGVLTPSQQKTVKIGLRQLFE
jgi:mRNA interferase MazF